MTLTPLGFFQELRHGHPDGGSIRRCSAEMPPDERPQRVMSTSEARFLLRRRNGRWT